MAQPFDLLLADPVQESGETPPASSSGFDVSRLESAEFVTEDGMAAKYKGSDKGRHWFRIGKHTYGFDDNGLHWYRGKLQIKTKTPPSKSPSLASLTDRLVDAVMNTSSNRMRLQVIQGRLGSEPDSPPLPDEPKGSIIDRLSQIIVALENENDEIHKTAFRLNELIEGK